MKEIKLKKMHIENFKGLRQFDVEFDDKLTRIVGANGSGKTTLHDAYLWLLTGMDSSESAAFKVQPLDEGSRTIPRLDTLVSCTMSVDGIDHEIKRVFKQKWVTPRGTNKPVMNGNTSDYFIDNVPMTLTEYSQAIATMFCRIEDFKLISSIYAFGHLDTKSKRAKLIQMAGTLPELMNETDYPHLYKLWESVKNVDSIKKTALFELGKLREEKAKIPTKMTENERDLPEGIDFDAIHAEIAEKNAEIESIDATLQKKADGRSGAFSELARLNDQLKDVEVELAEIEGSIRKQWNAKAQELDMKVSKANLEHTEKMSKRNILISENDVLRKDLERYEKKRTELIEKWKAKNAETFSDDVASECPTCHHVFTDDERQTMLEQLVHAFNVGKASILKTICDEGNEVKKQVDEIKERILAREKQIEDVYNEAKVAYDALVDANLQRANLPSVEDIISINKEHQTVLQKKAVIKQAIAIGTPSEDADETALKNKKEALKQEVTELIKKAALEQNIEKVEARRKELEAEDVRPSSEIAKVDAVLYEIQQYSKARINLVEDAVSSRFKMVRWKMYEPNLTNDGEREICECLVNGIPVSTNINTAGGVNAGIDIINALSEWLGLSVPLWIDGKESVTNLIDTPAQVVTLEVAANEQLKVA